MIQNYLKTGGIMGNKYSLKRLYEGANGFIRQYRNGSAFDKMHKITKGSIVEEKVRQQCGESSIIDNVMMTFLIMVPGQALPVHYDVPLFRDIPKENAPGKYSIIIFENLLIFNRCRELK